MPYILQEDRLRIDRLIVLLAERVETVGELNYVITRLALSFLSEKPGYAELSAVGGVLSDARDEFYRRRMAPYEDKKAETNGDVY